MRNASILLAAGLLSAGLLIPACASTPQDPEQRAPAAAELPVIRYYAIADT